MNEYRKIENIKQLVKITLVLLTLTHAAYGAVFYYLGIEIMAKVKATESLLALGFALLVLMLDKLYNFAVYFTHASILISCSICTFILGQEYGFLVIMVTILALGYVHDFKNSKYPLMIGILEVIFVMSVMILSKDIPSYNKDYESFFYIFNVLVVASIIVFYSSYTNSLDELEASKLEATNSELQNKADYDYLTEILNRRGMNEILQKYHEYFQKDQIRSFTVVLGDIDNFKSLNDECGHSFGDIVLKNTAKVIANGLKECEKSYCARWGGEEFLILFIGLSIDEGEKIINDIRKNFENFTHKDGYNSRKTTISFGICYALRPESIDYILSQADSALYKGKKNGKNRVETMVLGQI